MLDYNITTVYNVSQGYSTWSSPFRFLTFPVAVLMVIAIISANILVILAVYNTNKLKTIVNMYIVNLAVADLTVGLIIAPINAYKIFKTWPFNNAWCSVSLLLYFWTQTAAIWSVVAISADRYVAITRPFYYQIMWPKQARFYIAGVWIISFLFTFPTLITGQVQEDYCTYEEPITVLYSTFGSYILPLLLMLFLYWKIYKIAITATNTINKGFITTHNTVKLRMKKGQNINTNDTTVENFKKECKAAKTVGILIGVFILTCSPFFLTTLVAKIVVPQLIIGHFLEKNQVYAVVGWIFCCNSALNPVLYTFYHKDYRHALKRILCRR